VKPARSRTQPVIDVAGPPTACSHIAVPGPSRHRRPISRFAGAVQRELSGRQLNRCEPKSALRARTLPASAGRRIVVRYESLPRKRRCRDTKPLPNFSPVAEESVRPTLPGRLYPNGRGPAVAGAQETVLERRWEGLLPGSPSAYELRGGHR
jgi:hypothetical protein